LLIVHDQLVFWRTTTRSLPKSESSVCTFTISFLKLDISHMYYYICFHLNINCDLKQANLQIPFPSFGGLHVSTGFNPFSAPWQPSLHSMPPRSACSTHQT
jgi:hypothetical protein